MSVRRVCTKKSINCMATEQYAIATSALIGVYVLVILFFVIRGARNTRSMQDFALGSLSFSPATVALSLAASITSAATFIINPGFIALYGFSGVLAMAIMLPLGLFISLVVLSKSFRRYGQSVKALTMAQWIGKRYQHKGYALFFAFLSLLLITFIVLICVGMTKVLSAALDVSEWWVLVVMVAFVFGYMMFGGANSMVYTNTIQALLMLVVAVILLGSGYEHFRGGVMQFVDKLAAIDPNLTKAVNPGSLLFRDYFEVVFCNFIVGIAVVCQPHIITKSMLLQSDKDVNRYLIISIAVEILFFLVVLAGLYARIMFPDLTTGGQSIKMDSIMTTYVVQEFPVYVGLLVILGLLSAGLSTLEGLIQSLSTTLTSDIIDPLGGAWLGEGEKRAARLVRINKGVIVGLAVIAIVLSNQQLQHPNLSVGIFAQNGVYAYFSAAFVPVILGIYAPRASVWAPVAATLTAVVVHFGAYYGGWSWYLQGEVRNPAVAATYAILSSLTVGLITYYLTRKPLAAAQGQSVAA